MANGETVTDLEITDALPDSFVYIANSVNVNAAAATASSGQAITEQPVAGVPQNSPDNDFLIEFDSLTGSTAGDDIVITYTVYIGRNDADGDAVLDATSGNDVSVTNDAEVTGSYEMVTVGDNDGATDETLSQQSLSIQKGVRIANNVGHVGPTPGDTLEYTLNIQVSDYFEFSNLVIDDTFSDGQLFDTTFTPTYSFSEDGVTTNGNFDMANFEVMTITPVTGTTDVVFDLAAEVPDGVLTGDLYGDAVLDGGTTATVTFRTVIQESFAVNFPTLDASVDTGDVLTNQVDITGTLPSGETEVDGSGASVEIVGPAIRKEIYAIDGLTSLAGEDIVAGHTITYRLTFDMPTADYENLVLTDFLPLPIYASTELTVFSKTPTATPPPAGTATYGPLHNLHTVLPTTMPPSMLPTMTPDGVSNTVAFDFGTFDVAPSVPATVDLLFTLTARDVLMADNLYLTNQANASFGSTNNGVAASNAIVQNQVAAPELFLTKGIVSTNGTSPSFDSTPVAPVAFAPPAMAGPAFGGGINSTTLAATPIDSNVSDIDAGDLVKFAIIIENQGGADGFNLLIQDSIPAEYVIPASGLDLEVLDGDGMPLPFTGAAGDLFTTGIRLNDPGALTGSLNNLDDAQLAGDGSNIVVITYDLELAAAVVPATIYTNTATIAEYGAVDGGNDHTLGSSRPQWTDDATITVQNVEGTKSLVTTSEAHTSGANVAIGEIVRYRLVAEIPEGTMNDFQLIDRLPADMLFLDDGSSRVAFVSDSGITSNDIAGSLDLAVGAGANITGSAPVAPIFSLTDDQVGSTSSANSDPDLFENATDPRFKLGEIINNDRDANSEYVVIEFNALVMNTADQIRRRQAEKQL